MKRKNYDSKQVSRTKKPKLEEVFLMRLYYKIQAMNWYQEMFSNNWSWKTFQIVAWSHTVRNLHFLSKNSILTKPRHFHEFFTQIFLAIFLVKSKLSTAKKSKTATFSRVFLSQKIDNFSREIKVEFLDKKWRFRTVCGQQRLETIHWWRQIFGKCTVDRGYVDVFQKKKHSRIHPISFCLPKGLWPLRPFN